jgi:hypothetical protein
VQACVRALTDDLREWMALAGARCLGEVDAGLVASRAAGRAR